MREHGRIMVGLWKAARGIRTRAEKRPYSAVTTCPLETFRHGHWYISLWGDSEWAAQREKQRSWVVKRRKEAGRQKAKDLNSGMQRQVDKRDNFSWRGRYSIVVCGKKRRSRSRKDSGHFSEKKQPWVLSPGEGMQMRDKWERQISD